MTQLARNVKITQSFAAPVASENVTIVKIIVSKYENGVYTPYAENVSIPYTGVETEISLTLVATTADTADVKVQFINSTGNGAVLEYLQVVLPVPTPLPSVPVGPALVLLVV